MYVSMGHVDGANGGKKTKTFKEQGLKPLFLQEPSRCRTLNASVSLWLVLFAQVHTCPPAESVPTVHRWCVPAERMWKGGRTWDRCCPGTNEWVVCWGVVPTTNIEWVAWPGLWLAWFTSWSVRNQNIDLTTACLYS